jgi:hypothetical protein
VKTLKSMKWAGAGLGVLLIGIGAARSAQPDTTNLTTDPDHTIQAHFAGARGLDSVLVRACGDCHSNNMSSRWFTRVPPVSWVLARGAQEGRKVVNFAEWSTYSPEQQRAFLVASCADATTGKMPVPAYVRLNSDAKLSVRDIATICRALR